MANLYERVAARAVTAKEFSTQKELQEYLRLHPEAKKQNHSVKKPGPQKPGKTPPPIPPQAKKPAPKPAPAPAAKKAPPPLPPKAKAPAPAPEAKKPAAPAPEAQPPVEAKPHAEHAPDQGHGEHGEHAPAGPKKTWKERFTELSDGAKNFVRKAPHEVRQFISNPQVRQEALKSAQSHIAAAPKKAVHRLVETAKHEVKEFKDAAEGVKAVMSGGKMSKHQKHAFKTVATHLAIATAAAALTASGPLAGAAAFAKGMARHVAAKAVHHTFEKAHLLDELGHIGHGISHLMEHFASEGPAPQLNPEEVMGNFVMAAVAKELEKLTDDDIMAALNGMGEEQIQKEAARRVVARFLDG